MPVISAYSTSGSSYISPSSYRYKSSLSDRRSYTTSSSSYSSGTGSIYRRSSYRYDLPSSSAYSSYHRSTSDRTADAELATSLSTLTTTTSSTAAKAASPTVAATETSNAPSVVVTNGKEAYTRPSRYSSAYSSSYSSAPSRDYSSRISSRSSDNSSRAKDRDNNCLCAVGGAGSSYGYASSLRNTALSGADLYQKYSVSSYKPCNTYERLIASSRSPSDTAAKPSSGSILAKAASPTPTALDISKVNNIPAKDRNSNFDAVIVASNNNNPTNTSNGTTTTKNTTTTTTTPTNITSLDASTASTTNLSNPGVKPANAAAASAAACLLNVRSEICPAATTSNCNTITTTTNSSTTSVLLSSSSSSSVLYDTTASPGRSGQVRKTAATFQQRSQPPPPLSRLRPTGGKPPLVPKGIASGLTGSSSDLAISSGSQRPQLGLSTYRNQNFLKHECDLVKRELSKSATEIAFRKGAKPCAATYLPKVKQFLPPVASQTNAGQPKDHEDDDKKHHHHHIHHHKHQTNSNNNNNSSQLTGIPPQLPPKPTPPSSSSTSAVLLTSGVELKPIDRPATSFENSTQKNDTFLFKPSSSCSTTTPTTPTTTTTTTTSESLTTASFSPSTRTEPCTYNTTNSRSVGAAIAMKSLHITSELEESITQATIKLRPSLNGTSNGTTTAKFIATASATTDDLGHNGPMITDYHHVTATVRIKPKSSISHHSTSSSSNNSSTNGSTTSVNNNNNGNDGGSSSSDEQDQFRLRNGNGTKSNGNNNNDEDEDEEDEDDDSDDDGEEDNAGDQRHQDLPKATGANSAVDKDPKSNDDDKGSYLRAGTASKSIHSTSPVGYRSRDYDSGIGSSSYRSGLGSSSTATSSAVHKSSYDRSQDEVSEAPRSGSSRKEGLCGLWNIGNTCFMNSVIQCLSHTRELTNYLRNQPSTERGTNKDHKILAEYTKLIKDMWNGTNRSVNPSELKYAFSSKHRMYSGSAQQDAQEFLRFFIDSLHGALNVSVKREPISKEIEDDDMANRVKSAMMWDWYSKVENSMIKDLFVGLLRSTLRCTVCNNASVTFDPFWDLSLPLPSTNSRCKLDNCMDEFVREEIMDGIDQPTCSKCKTRRKCTKSLAIERFPKYLVIHLKRFSETRWSKLTNVIEFPTGERELNLQPYACEDHVGPVNYSLYGISNHMGSTAGGHYVAVCKHPVSKEWNEFNDNFVSETSERSLVTSSAYVLFYERA